MIRIVPDKEGRLTQWDKDRKVIVTGFEDGAEVHFASPGDDHGAYVVELTGGEAAVPNILLTMAGVVNVYVYPADRTVFAVALPVMAREKPDDYIYTETEVLSYKTLDEKIGDLAKLTTAAKENLVAAINEAATKGTASIYMRVAEGYIEYSGDGVTWEKLIAVSELKGPKGEKGDAGAQGQQGEKGEKGDKGDPGKDAAADISLGITSAAVGDIVKVKTVDASGKPTEWEAAGLRMPLVFREILPGGTNAYIRTVDLNNKPFSLSRWELWVRIPVVIGAIPQTTVFYVNNGTTYGGATHYFNDTSVPCYYYQLCDYIAQNGMSGRRYSDYSERYGMIRDNVKSTFDKCTKIKIDTFNAEIMIPAGTEVTLFGIE